MIYVPCFVSLYEYIYHNHKVTFSIFFPTSVTKPVTLLLIEQFQLIFIMENCVEIALYQSQLLLLCLIVKLS